jgi:UDP-N-acetylglucosamine--N-acetylmuramyl-(pentapeptide) pyrophosphoryl-undecaprenol N-acetylglucosamine transferase
MSVRVVFAGGGTGGHLYPALNIAAALTELRPDIRPLFIGARRGVEARVLPERGVDYQLLPLEPIHRDRVWRNWRLAPALLTTLWRLTGLGIRSRPGLIVGTGGYASGPACGWAVLTRVPLAIQEQNSVPGLTTRWLSKFARQVHLGFPEAEARLMTGKRTEVICHGNPIQPPDPAVDRGEARAAFGLARDALVVLVMGGSQGARAINEALIGALRRVAGGAADRPMPLEILWATGPTHVEAVRAAVAPLNVSSWVHPVGYIDGMSQALAAADLAVSRAGAMGTAEILAWGIPSILVPLPTAAADHQSHNALALDAYGAAVALPEAELSAQRLWAELMALVADRPRREAMAARARERAKPGAARAIARDLVRILEAS